VSVPLSTLLTHQWATAVSLACIGGAAVVAASGTNHVISGTICSLALRLRFDAHGCLLKNSRSTSPGTQGPPPGDPAFLSNCWIGRGQASRVHALAEIEGPVNLEQHDVVGVPAGGTVTGVLVISHNTAGLSRSCVVPVVQTCVRRTW